MAATADVYGGDLDARREREGHIATGTYAFRVLADATPDVLSRVANVFNAANRTPGGASLRHRPHDHVEIEVIMTEISAQLAGYIARKLDQLMMVVRVEVDSL